MVLSVSEENYLKAIYKLSQNGGQRVSTNAIAKEMATAAASVTDMIQKLSEKHLVDYRRYKGASLSDQGMIMAKRLIRKHRLWEVFLHDKLGFGWDEIHDIAEQLEHVRSSELVERLDQYLGFPKFDPHGDPIPNAVGTYTLRNQMELPKLGSGDRGLIVGVREHSSDFLQLLEKLELTLGRQVTILTHHDFDQSVELELDNGQKRSISAAVAQNIFVKPI